MNTSLRRIAVTIMALIVLLLANATLTQVFKADGLRADPRNQRVLLDEYSRQRGQISAGGQLLAYSVSTEGRFRFLRVYPNPLAYAPVTGFYSLSYSSAGLERAEDSILNGSDQRLFGRRLADFFTGRDPRGGNVATTINPQVQQAAWDAMEDGCNGPCKGAVVALEPSTGKVLAMVSSPSYDPNLLATHDIQAQSTAWQQLRDNPDSPLLNRAISETYPPGSTFKLVIAGAALRAREDTDHFVCLRLPGGRVGNYVRGMSRPVRDDPMDTTPHGQVDLRHGLVVSCNAYFAQLAMRLGPQPILDAASLFQIDAARPATAAALRRNLPHAGYGQADVLVSPLKMARVAAAIADRGLVGPVQWTADSAPPADEPRQRFLTDADAATLSRYMREAVTSGTGRTLASNATPIAGKTGTAEVDDDRAHSWFAGFAPYGGTKRIAFAVVVENAGYGSRAAAPIAGEIVNAARDLGLIK